MAFLRKLCTHCLSIAHRAVGGFFFNGPDNGYGCAAVTAANDIHWNSSVITSMIFGKRCLAASRVTDYSRENHAAEPQAHY